MKVMVSFSGGKDSTAMLLRMLELGEQVDGIVFADTGFEYPELYEYIPKVEKYIGREITVLNPNKDTWDKWFYGKITRGKKANQQRGFPYVIYPCWFMREVKLKPLQNAQKNFDVICVGIAYDEQERVQKDPRIRYPLIEWKWTEQDCVNYLNEKQMLNPLYQNVTRLGCWHCPYQNVVSLYVLWKNYQELWERLKKYEADCPHGFKPNTKLIDLEKKFKTNPPTRKVEFACYGCQGVRKAFGCQQLQLIKGEVKK
jgi:3'-phosphoadenosine 5'-phosphosulfate sulfotransferase (PAPS reductase)/FAD synthetase